jgi:hypothetical protein
LRVYVDARIERAAEFTSISVYPMASTQASIWYHIFHNLLSTFPIINTMAQPQSVASASEASKNPFGALIEQELAIVPSFTLESGATLKDIPVAYKTWGKLNERADNVLVICHALTGSADVEDW